MIASWRRKKMMKRMREVMRKKKMMDTMKVDGKMMKWNNLRKSIRIFIIRSRSCKIVIDTYDFVSIVDVILIYIVSYL